ncbi:hypothetical protein [Heyndrickxia sporothermodurans]|uniref:hypothetical protein n=1 Tax=Heyndrickxia sporothermodurans TaxID=46224 RepID=UPI002E1A9AF8|nr:hypothetical protein [Heyndrickxia sporothermodurans]MED3697924.1 hypothetical protein [Heyndrickxia sporothermodurans]
MGEAISNQTLIIDVEKKRSGFAKGFGRIIAYTIGGFGILLASLLCLTIIGIFPGIGLFFMSIGLIYLAKGKQQVACPHCKKKQPVIQTAENFTCPKCRQLTVINWK